MSQKNRIVLAYSGGLDTSCILKYLQQEGFEVIAFIANVGQQEDFELLRKRALNTGAASVHIADLRDEFIREFIFPAIAGNAIYENRYLLGTSLARPLIAKRQIEIALAEKATHVSHGATGKGNDQVRFELAYYALAPQIQVFAPWKDATFLSRFKGRQDLLRYATEHQIPVETTFETPYSTDENLMHKSYESGVLEDPSLAPQAEMFTITRALKDTPEKPDTLAIHFKDAYPIQVQNLETSQSFQTPLDLFLALNEIGSVHGIGRVDMVENRFVGIKSRGVYETPGGTILHQAIRDLEGIAMDREVLHLRDSLSAKFSELIYNGFWYSPEMDFIRAAFKQAQSLIDGTVQVQLFKGNVIPMGRTSPSSLYDQNLSSMDVAGGYDQSHADGFIKINALRLKAHSMIIGNPGKGPSR